MLETFRKYTGLMFVVLILLFIGLVFFGSSGQGVFSGPKVIYAHGKGYTSQEVNRFAHQPARLLGALRMTPGGQQAVGPFLFQMGIFGARLEDDQVYEFLVNRASLHRAMEQFGVAASTAEIEQFLKEELFWQDGRFDEQAYAEFEQDTLGKLGMSVKQMNDLVGEVIAYNKLNDILAAGVDASREAALAQHLSNTQRISYKLVSLPLSEFEAKQMPTDEELKAYWEENKGNYLSEPKRRISYILAKPDSEALENDLEGDGKDAPPEEDEAAETEGDNENGPAGEPDAPPADSTLTEEDRKRAVIKIATRLDGLLDRLDDAEGKGFEKLAEEMGFEVKTTELVTKEALPAELQGDLADVPGQTGADLIFQHSLGVDAMSAFGDIKKVGSDQWLFFRVDEEVEPAELSYEEAKEDVRTDLVRKSALEEMEEAAKEKRAAIKEAMAAGKSFDEAAKELELTVTPNLDVTRPPRDDPAATTAFNLAARTNPGELSEVEVDTSTEPDEVNRAIFAYVEKREVYENKNLDTLIDRQVDRARQRNQRLAVANWFAEQRRKADIKFPAP